MARYEHLPIYKLIYDFILYFFKLSRNFPKDYKYGLAVEIRGNLTKLLDKIIIANNSASKGGALKEAEIIVEQIKLKIRILKDLGIIGLKVISFAPLLQQIFPSKYKTGNPGHKGTEVRAP